jgi:hypothetical protein
MQRLKSCLLIVNICLLWGCSGKHQGLSDNELRQVNFKQFEDSFTRKYLFDRHQNLLKLDIDKLSSSQIDSLLRHLLVMDQKFRIQLRDERNGEIPDQDNLKELFGKMEDADLINYTLIKRINEKIGWPSKTVYSDSAVEASFFITLHYKGHDLDYLTPLIEESFSKNQIKKDHYAILTDRVLLRKGNSQKFGTHCRMTGEGTVDFISLPDTSGINQSRREIGLKELNWKTCDLVSF